MSEYWKSLPRKFCDICKCWFADNKASIEFHERGKRHQENAQKRIQDIQKRGIKDFKKQKQLEDDMAKIEKAALAAYKKDLQNNVEAVTSNDAWKASNSFVEIPEIKKNVPKPAKKKKEKLIVVEKKEPPKETQKVWYEAMTDEGHKYFWNTENSESQWEPPEEGYISLEEQAKLNSDVDTENHNDVKEESYVKQEEDDKNDKEPISAIGPQPKIDPYGQWVTIVEHQLEEIDLQLPKPSEDIVEVVIPIARDEPKFKFKEKVIGYSLDADPSEEVTFKKRKFTGSSKRNARQRTTDD